MVITDMNGTFLDSVGGKGPLLRDGDFDTAAFNRPQGLAYSARRDALYVADTENNVIREVRKPIFMIKCTSRVSSIVHGINFCLVQVAFDARRVITFPKTLQFSSPWDVALDSKVSLLPQPSSALRADLLCFCWLIIYLLASSALQSSSYARSCI